MKYTLPRQILNPDFNKFIAREIRSQDLEILQAPFPFLKGMAKACRQIEKEGIPEHLVLKKVKGMGQGIFLRPEAEPILKGEVIACYAGTAIVVPQNEEDDSDYAFSLISDIRLSKEEQSLFDPKRRYHPRRLYALDVDALKKGNFTRFINHSEQPNIEAEMVGVPKNRFGLEPSLIEVVYVAKKKIRPGEQLLVCYEGEDKSYWHALGIQPKPVTPRTFLLSV